MSTITYPIADGHCDLLSKIFTHKADFNFPKEGQMVSLPGLIAGGVKLQVFAAWYDPRLPISPLEQCQRMIAEYRNMLKNNTELQELSLQSAVNSEKIEIALTVEGGEVLESDLDNLQILKKSGVLALSLTWNHDNQLASANGSPVTIGLTDFGKQAVIEMGRLGMAVDVSHLSDQGISDVLDLPDTPVFASHSNCRAVYPCNRSLPDQFIRAIAKRGGVIGINFFHEHLGTTYPSTQEVVCQLRHLVKVGGIDCCAIGSDFDGISYALSDLQGSSDFQKLGIALQQAGFSPSEIEQILYKNLRGFLQRLLSKQHETR